MKSAQLLQGLEFDSAKPHASAQYVDKQGRAIVWTLEPNQSIHDHQVPQSPFYVVVLQGHGWFAGAENKEEWVGPNTLLIFDPGERHRVRAGEERLVFVGFLHGAPGNISDKVGGEIGREAG
jgi:quercetin dioxygenase-like cupin family protein